MAPTQQYEVEGMLIDIPFCEAEKTGRIIELYPDFLGNPLWTPMGHRVLFCGTDACIAAVEATPGGCLDCGSCKYFQSASENTWFGVCTNKHSPRNTERVQNENREPG